MRKRFLDLLADTNRPGIGKLCAWLAEETDFFTAPASTQHHGAHECGLLEHSLAVYENLLKIYKAFDGYVVVDETKVIAPLLHDICKANFYTIDYRNKKNEFGQWEKVPYYAINDQFPAGHGEKSVILAMKFITLTDEESMAIRWHMGGFGASDYATSQALAGAMNKYPLITALHMADLAATYFDGK